MKSDAHVIWMFQVARAQAVAGRLANQLAPSDTQPHQATADLADDRADDEQQSPVHADGAQAAKSPPAGTAAKAQGVADRLPSNSHKQPNRAAQKQVREQGQGHVTGWHASVATCVPCMPLPVTYSQHMEDGQFWCKTYRRSAS